MFTFPIVWYHTVIPLSQPIPSKVHHKEVLLKICVISVGIRFHKNYAGFDERQRFVSDQRPPLVHHVKNI